jgi:ferredoxin
LHREVFMKFAVNDSCIGCGACDSICPEVFSTGASGKAQAIEKDVPLSAEASAEEARKSCPVGAIERK